MFHLILNVTAQNTLLDTQFTAFKKARSIQKQPKPAAAEEARAGGFSLHTVNVTDIHWGICCPRCRGSSEHSLPALLPRRLPADSTLRSKPGISMWFGSLLHELLASRLIVRQLSPEIRLHIPFLYLSAVLPRCTFSFARGNQTPCLPTNPISIF